MSLSVFARTQVTAALQGARGMLQQATTAGDDAARLVGNAASELSTSAGFRIQQLQSETTLLRPGMASTAHARLDATARMLHGFDSMPETLRASVLRASDAAITSANLRLGASVGERATLTQLRSMNDAALAQLSSSVKLAAHPGMGRDAERLLRAAGDDLDFVADAVVARPFNVAHEDFGAVHAVANQLQDAAVLARATARKLPPSGTDLFNTVETISSKVRASQAQLRAMEHPFS